MLYIPDNEMEEGYLPYIYIEVCIYSKIEQLFLPSFLEVALWLLEDHFGSLQGTKQNMLTAKPLVNLLF